MSRRPAFAEVLERNAWLFEERDRRLRALARQDPYRHPPNQRTWQDLEEIRRREDPITTEQAAELDRIYKAMMLSPRDRSGLEICQALLRGEDVPVELLDPDAVRRYGLR